MGDSPVSKSRRTGGREPKRTDRNAQSYGNWRDDSHRNFRIITALGLVSENLNNRVIDRLGSTAWSSTEGSPIIQTKRVEFVVLCIDPFDRTISPGLKELIQQPTKFRLVYNDDLSAIFKVNNSG